MRATRMLRMAFVGHGLLVSTALIAGVVPLVLPLWLLVLTVLATGTGEGKATRLLAQGRRPSSSDANVLAPAMARLNQAGFANLRVRIVPRSSRLSADWIGRRTLLVNRALLVALCSGHIDVATAPGLIEHAAARQQVARARFDIAVRVGCLPVTWLAALGRRLWIVRAVWQLRGLTAILMLLVTAFAPVDSTAAPYTRQVVVAMAAFFLLSYLPAHAERAWNQRVARAADGLLARHRLTATAPSRVDCSWGTPFEWVAAGGG